MLKIQKKFLFIKFWKKTIPILIIIYVALVSVIIINRMNYYSTQQKYWAALITEIDIKNIESMFLIDRKQFEKEFAGYKGFKENKKAIINLQNYKKSEYDKIVEEISKIQKREIISIITSSVVLLLLMVAVISILIQIIIFKPFEKIIGKYTKE